MLRNRRWYYDLSCCVKRLGSEAINRYLYHGHLGDGEPIVKPTKKGRFCILRRRKNDGRTNKSSYPRILKATVEGDVTKALSFLADDVVNSLPDGTFKGKAEFKYYMTALSKKFKETKITETRIGIITQGNIGVIEHILSGTMRGIKGEVPPLCVYAFKNGKMQNIRGYDDRLALAKQAAKGPTEKMMVNMFVNTMEKGFKQKTATKT